MADRDNLTKGEKVVSGLFWTVIAAFFAAGAIGGILYLVSMFWS